MGLAVKSAFSGQLSRKAICKYQFIYPVLEVYSYTGMFVFQVDNTDAEGRLILADALCYGHTFSPRAIVNVATLTGTISSTVHFLSDMKFSSRYKTLMMTKC